MILFRCVVYAVMVLSCCAVALLRGRTGVLLCCWCVVVVLLRGCVVVL